MNKTVKILLGMMFLISAVGADSLVAQEIRYINSIKIMAEYKETQDVQKKLQDLQTQYERELQAKRDEIISKQKDYEAKQLVLSEENKRQKEQELSDLIESAEKYRLEKFGQNGEFFRKSQELQTPIIDKINKVLNRIALEKGYDFILDLASDGVVYAKDTHDITNVVLEELNRTSGSAGK